MMLSIWVTSPFLSPITASQIAGRSISARSFRIVSIASAFSVESYEPTVIAIFRLGEKNRI